jgi:hypothetical protein
VRRAAREGARFRLVPLCPPRCGTVALLVLASPIAEVLTKVLCHNLCCLVSAFFELGIDAKFWNIESVA